MRMFPTLLLLCPLLLLAQITTTSRPLWESYTSTNIHADKFRRIDLPHNSPEAVLEEMFDDALIRSIGKAVGLTDKNLSGLRLVWDKNSEYEWKRESFELCWKSHDKEAEILRKALDHYMNARNEGRTKEFMQAAITNLTPMAEIKDPGIRGIVKEHPLTPASLLKKTHSNDSSEGTATEYTYERGKETIVKTVKVKGRAYYKLEDGDIGWSYSVEFKADDGSAYSVSCSRYDTKDRDEKYAEMFRQVEAEVKKEMDEKGWTGFGSCHTFWQLKKEKLAERGITWRSPSELNPGTNYD